MKWKIFVTLLLFGVIIKLKAQDAELKNFVSQYYSNKTIAYTAINLPADKVAKIGKAYKVMIDGRMAAYACELVVNVTGEEFGTYPTTLGVLFGPDKAILSVRLIKFNENQREEGKNIMWANQFNGKSNGIGMIFKKDIKNISRATLSCKAITEAVREMSIAVYGL